MATATQTQTESPPQLTVLYRVASIPLVSDSLATIHSTLINNFYTRTPYTTAQAIGTRAYRVSQPIQVRLAPVIVRADGFANKAVDVVESRYPYPFKTPTDEIYGDIKRNREHAVGVANKTIDDKVKAPAYDLAQGIDQRFTPVVDRIEVVMNKLQGQKVDSAPHPEDKFQYQRAYRLSLGFKDQLYVYTTEQVKQIQEHNVLVQRATATAQSISGTLASSYDAANARVHAMSTTMLGELQRLQASAAALPSHLQASLNGLADGAAELGAVLRSDRPFPEKIGALRSTLEERVQPLLARASAVMQDTLRAVTRKAEVVENGVEEKVQEGEKKAHKGHKKVKKHEKKVTGEHVNGLNGQAS